MCSKRTSLEQKRVSVHIYIYSSYIYLYIYIFVIDTIYLSLFLIHIYIYTNILFLYLISQIEDSLVEGKNPGHTPSQSNPRDNRWISE